jgi:hypothetical protein
MAFSSYPAKGGIPSGITAARPSGPASGDTFYNGTLGLLEIYDGTNWVPCSSPAAIPTVAVADVGTDHHVQLERDRASAGAGAGAG